MVDDDECDRVSLCLLTLLNRGVQFGGLILDARVELEGLNIRPPSEGSHHPWFECIQFNTSSANLQAYTSSISMAG